MTTYTIAIKREALDWAPYNWIHDVWQTRGVHLLSWSATRARVEIDTDEALYELAELISGYAHIEPLIGRWFDDEG